MQNTENFNFKLPESTDNYNVGDYNENFEAIDAELQAVNESVAENTDHRNDTENPHGVSAADVGLGNVPNVATNDQTPTYVAATENTALSSGEKLSIAFGKIAKAISSLISHLTDSVAHITSAERTKWNNKADVSHTQAASTITAGTLGGQVVANATSVATLGTKQVRNIYAGTSEMTSGTSSLPAGDIYIQYE